MEFLLGNFNCKQKCSPLYFAKAKYGGLFLSTKNQDFKSFIFSLGAKSDMPLAWYFGFRQSDIK